MKTSYMIVMTGSLLGAMVCGAAPKVTPLKQVGPDPGQMAHSSSDGFLQVYTARERAPIDVNAETFFCNNDFGRNEFLYGKAHTAYSIYDADGRLVQRVRNSTGMNDSNPTRIGLSPGVYRIDAEAADYGNITLTVTVPVCVEPGFTTALHLDGTWKPISPAIDSEMVRLPNGRIVGYSCPGSDNAKFASNARK
jgi:hypothetical protein